jgi:hypothetical protein
VHPRVNPRREPTHHWGAKPGMGIGPRRTPNSDRICAIDRPVREAVFFRRPRGWPGDHPAPAGARFSGLYLLAVKRLGAVSEGSISRPLKPLIALIAANRPRQGCRPAGGLKKRPKIDGQTDQVRFKGPATRRDRVPRFCGVSRRVHWRPITTSSPARERAPASTAFPTKPSWRTRLAGAVGPEPETVRFCGVSPPLSAIRGGA